MPFRVSPRGLCPLFFFFFNKFIYFIYFIFGCVGSLLQYTGFLLWCLLLLQSMGSRRVGFSTCGLRPPSLWLADSRAQAQ